MVSVYWTLVETKVLWLAQQSFTIICLKIFDDNWICFMGDYQSSFLLTRWSTCSQLILIISFFKIFVYIFLLTDCKWTWFNFTANVYNTFHGKKEVEIQMSLKCFKQPITIFMSFLEGCLGCQHIDNLIIIN